MDRDYIGTLFQIYGKLLNDKQAFAVRLYYFEDFSLSEIAEHTDTSRQAVSNLLKRSEDLLLTYESELSLYKRSEYLRNEINSTIEKINDDKLNKEGIISILSNMLEKI